jgi:hypothetical protein
LLVKEIYIELLIKLIELNEDKSWLKTFYDLRKGASLPGGGAGSLNDWGPVYIDEMKHTWFSNLYNILRHLIDNNLLAEQLVDYSLVKFNNQLRMIKCRNCNKGYQHPSVFESHIAINFYGNHFIHFDSSDSLLDLLIPEFTFMNVETIQYRAWLFNQYELNEIKVYDFVAHNYTCPHCLCNNISMNSVNYLIKNDELKMI